MDDETKKKAVEFARSFLSRNVLLDDLNYQRKLELSNPALERIRADQNWEALERAAANPDTNDYDVLIWSADCLLRQNKRLPIWLAKFVADVLSGKQKRPTKRGPEKDGNWVRDHKYWRATQAVAKEFKLPHYSNNIESNKTTAAEIISQAAGCKIDVVITAYKKFNRSVRGK